MKKSNLIDIINSIVFTDSVENELRRSITRIKLVRADSFSISEIKKIDEQLKDVFSEMAQNLYNHFMGETLRSKDVNNLIEQYKVIWATAFQRVVDLEKISFYIKRRDTSFFDNIYAIFHKKVIHGSLTRLNEMPETSEVHKAIIDKYGEINPSLVAKITEEFVKRGNL